MLQLLGNRGALFRAEISSQLKLAENAVPTALWTLLRLGLATNDRFDLFRRGAPPISESGPWVRSRGELRAFLRQTRPVVAARTETLEGRWSMVELGES